MTPPMNPYVVTLAVDEATQGRWDAERAAYFPAGRTRVGAHVTLFHAVPGELDAEADLRAACARPGFDVTVSEVVGLGRGVAYRLDSGELADLHATLRSRWLAHLTRQDAQGFRAHVTVQNKVTAEVAAATLADVRVRFTAYDVSAVGVDLWRYLDGPWAHVRRHPFQR